MAQCISLVTKCIAGSRGILRRRISIRRNARLQRNEFVQTHPEGKLKPEPKLKLMLVHFLVSERPTLFLELCRLCPVFRLLQQWHSNSPPPSKRHVFLLACWEETSVLVLPLGLVSPAFTHTCVASHTSLSQAGD